MRAAADVDAEIYLGDEEGDNEDEESESNGGQPWKGRLETVVEEEEEEDIISTQSDTRPLLNERDPRQINECLKVSFEDVIAEPTAVRSGDRVWLWSHALFEVSRVWSYRIITALLAAPVSILAGILFAVLSFLHIWLLSPCIKAILVNTGWLETLWHSILDIFILPFFYSAAKCYGGVGVRLTQE
ncbi:caveolin-2 [Electrophorus electricus]|uniref:Caveolin n=1 Tax=Electrophorus electricus TaxID=8005 RepID=A0AAY5EDD1_ELEEL|nr:caveolin-2 [Electrophorus electricus]